MNKEWLDNIICTKKQKSEIIEWCQYIGFERYEKLYVLLKSKLENVEYKQLRAMAQYDLRLSDYLHSMIKLVELRLRALITKEYGDIELTYDSYLYEITSVLGDNKRYLSKKTHFNEKDVLTLSEYVNSSSMDTLLKIIDVLSDEKLYDLSTDIDILKEDLKLIKKIRNEVAHSRILLATDNALLKLAVQTILKYLPTKQTKERRIKELNIINSKFLKASCIDVSIAKQLIVIV